MWRRGKLVLAKELIVWIAYSSFQRDNVEESCINTIVFMLV